MNAKYFVPFETAKQLKEKGYPQAWADMYYSTSSSELLYKDATPDIIVTGIKDFDNYYVHYFAAPTYHEVVDWLEGKGIILVTDAKRYRGGLIYWCNIGWGVKFEETDEFPTREEALNAAILVALSMI